MTPKHRRLISAVLGLAVLGVAAWYQLGAPAGPSTGQPHSATTAAGTPDLQLVVSDVTVKSHGRQVLRGDVDLTRTVERILAGEKHPHRNDGSVFQNREGRLPKQPRGYYREYVHPTQGLSGPGPQRLVRGDGGEWYYTPDHYGTFVRIDRGGGS